MRCQRRKKPRLPRVPLPRQRGGPHGPRNDKQARVLRARKREED